MTELTPLQRLAADLDRRPATVVYLQRIEAAPAPRTVNHVLHGVLTFFSCGLWAPVWLTLTLTTN